MTQHWEESSSSNDRLSLQHEVCRVDLTKDFQGELADISQGGASWLPLLINHQQFISLAPAFTIFQGLEEFCG